MAAILQDKLEIIFRDGYLDILLRGEDLLEIEDLDTLGPREQRVTFGAIVTALKHQRIFALEKQDVSGLTVEIRPAEGEF